jgi:hypothetical protein
MEVILLWIKYTGKLPYNSMELRDVQPESRIEVKESLGNKLIKKRPKWFKSCSAPKKGPGAEVIDEPIVETKKKDEVKKK